MPDFGFVGAAYEAPSITQDAQECINFYPEIDPTKAQGERGIVALYPTPGLETVAIFPNQEEVRGLRTLSGGQQVVAVCGDFVYVLEDDLTPVMIGQMNTSTGQVGIVDNGVNVYIVDDSYRYTWFISAPSPAGMIFPVPWRAQRNTPSSPAISAFLLRSASLSGPWWTTSPSRPIKR
jgi:hypothetical protein